MRYLAAILLLCSASLWAAPAEVNAVATRNTGSSLSVTLNVSAGNTLYVAVNQDLSSCGSAPAVTYDSTSLTQIGTVNSHSFNCGSQWYLCNTTADSSGTITVNPGSTQLFSFSVTQISGLATSSCLDTFAVGSAFSGTSVTSGTFTTTGADFIIAGMTQYYLNSSGSPFNAGAIGGTTATIDANSLAYNTVGNGAQVGAEYVVATGSQSNITAADTITSSTSAYGWIMVAAFVPSGGGSTNPQKRRHSGWM